MHIPPLEQLLHSAHIVKIPLKTTFRGISERETLIFTGPNGPGEWAAFPEYSDQKAAAWLASALEQAFDDELGTQQTRQHDIAVNATFPALQPADIPDWWKWFPGAESVKVKVGEYGHNLSDDLGRLRAISEVVGPDVSIRLDANGQYTVDEAETLIRQASKVTLDYVEQPVRTVDEMVELRDRLSDTQIRLAADELIRHDGALDLVIEKNAAEVAVLKVAPLGGIQNTLQAARRAHTAGLDVVISSALESSVGLAWGVRAAALLQDEWGAIPDAGLGTSVFLTQDVVQNPLRVVRGRVAVDPPMLDQEMVRNLRAPTDREEWWHDRLKRCLPLAFDILSSRSREPSVVSATNPNTSATP